MVEAKCYHYASYNALCWLRDHHGVEIDGTQYSLKKRAVISANSDGNTLLHRIAQSNNSLRFIRTVGRIERKELKVENPISLFHMLYDSLNKEKKSFIDILIDRGDTKSLDSAFSLFAHEPVAELEPHTFAASAIKRALVASRTSAASISSRPAHKCKCRQSLYQRRPARQASMRFR